jgi:hypothetical protein
MSVIIPAFFRSKLSACLDAMSNRVFDNLTQFKWPFARLLANL